MSSAAWPPEEKRAWAMNGSLRSARPESPSHVVAIACSIIECLGPRSVGLLTCNPCAEAKRETVVDARRLQRAGSWAVWGVYIASCGRVACGSVLRGWQKSRRPKENAECPTQAGAQVTQVTRRASVALTCAAKVSGTMV